MQSNTGVMTDNIYDSLSRERKELQAQGLIPAWATTSGWQLFKAKYLYEAPSWKAQYERIAKTAAQYTDDPAKWEVKFFDIMWKGWLSLSTPVLANMGTDRGLPISCSGCYVGDDVASFYEVQTEIAVLSKHGFGTSAYLGDIRPRGSKISVGGKASGVMPVLKGLVQVCRDISQGSARRGAGAWYLPIEHGDFQEVIDYVKGEPDDVNIGWCISDAFTERMQQGDADAIQRFQETMSLKMTLGKGYYFFPDKANRQVPDCYKAHGLDIKASQLCVTGNQMVITSGGLKSVYELYETQNDLTLFDNSKAVKASPMRLVEKNAEVFRVTLRNGMSHDVTGYHKIKTDNGMVECKNLEIGQRVHFQTNKGLFGSIHKPREAFLLGLYQADGSQNNASVLLDLWANDFDLVPEIEKTLSELWDEYPELRATTGKGFTQKPIFRDAKVCESVTGVKVAKKRLTTCLLSKMGGFVKGKVPYWIYEADEETQWQYIRGLFYADGTYNVTTSQGCPSYLSITNTSKDFLKELQLILANLGTKFSVFEQGKGGMSRLPNGHGEYALYETKPSWRLVCGNKPDALLFNRNTGFIDRKGKFIEDREYRDNARKVSEIVSIEQIENQDVYCTTVDSDEHVWICNGFITSNCTEIMLHSGSKYTYTCCLSSMVAALWDEWKDTDAVFTATVFLDCVMQDFIEKAKHIRHLEKAVAFSEKGRALGLGQMGLFSLFQKKGLNPEGFEAHGLNNLIAMKVWSQALQASKWMAEKWGEPEWCKGFGMRNTHLLAVAPTKSTASIMGGWSEGINPDPACAFSASTAAGDIDRITPVLLQVMKDKGVFNQDTVNDIIANGGSVQHVKWLNEDEKKVFKTAFEIDQHVLIRLAATRQQWIDQGQSLNLFFSASDSPDYISEVHQEAFENEHILSLYYIYSTSALKTDRNNICESCQ